MRQQPDKTGILHFVGIGGIGMSGIAEVLHRLGYQVQGSDISESANVKRLRDKGMSVHIGHEAKNVDGVAVIVVSSAIRKDNPELIAARKARIPVVRRADMLAELMRLKTSVAVAGTHGKTTTTSMIGEMLGSAGFDPTVINGGIVNSFGTNMRMGESAWMVVEADESDGSFTRLPASIAVVTNIDPEHMDHYGDFEAVKKAYRDFIENLPFYGYAVLCLDHPEVQSLIAETTDRRVVTYGFSTQADIRGLNVRHQGGGQVFDVMIDGKTIQDIYLPMLGRHNVQNALAALAIAHEEGIASAMMKQALSELSGVKRRFTQTGIVDGIRIIDDYAHHPVEIETVLKTARDAAKEQGGKVIAVMQPHRYSRLRDLFDQFCTCFNDADTVLIANVYGAGESPIEGFDRDSLCAGIAQHGHKDVTSLESESDLPHLLAEKASSGDYILFMGAGNITAWAYDFPAQFTEFLDQTAKKRA